MEIKINNELLEKEMNACTEKAIKEAFNHYEVNKIVREKVAEEVIEKALASAISKAAKIVDIDKLAQTLAVEIAKHITSSTIFLLQEQTVEAIFKLQGRNSYDRDSSQQKARILARLQNNK